MGCAGVCAVEGSRGPAGAVALPPYAPCARPHDSARQRTAFHASDTTPLARHAPPRARSTVAGGSYFCDIYWSPGPNTVFLNDDSSTSGYRPIPNTWHHLVWTYTGASSTAILSVYVDGQLSTAVGRQLAIIQVPYIHLGSCEFRGSGRF